MRERISNFIDQHQRVYVIILVAIMTFIWSVVRLVFVKGANLPEEIGHFFFLTAFVAIGNGIVWFFKDRKSK
ncbi:hypothetical protein NFX39_01945 [Fructobacillus sp. W13]|uniref:Uncharacterized protein n=1 Tax=Fructobacillus apis TaxID=2935017 RepID=A0ABT0ZPG2_9LACO|nr:hypothetical protein [Fructobacillus apis]MCO0831857.1 hypothetical protein [Fructobacillus apis]